MTFDWIAWENKLYHRLSDIQANLLGNSDYSETVPQPVLVEAVTATESLMKVFKKRLAGGHQGLTDFDRFEASKSADTLLHLFQKDERFIVADEDAVNHAKVVDQVLTNCLLQE